MDVELTILVPALPERRLSSLPHLKDLARQTAKKPVEFLYDDSPASEISTGAKVGRMMGRAVGDYLCTIDDDDRVTGDYVDVLLQTIEGNPDCELITFDLLRVDLGEHWSFGYEYEDRTRDPRRPNWLGMRANHLCVWKSDLARTVTPPDRNNGWDVDWYTQIRTLRSSVREVHLERIMYLYFYDSDVSVCQRRK